MRKLGDATKNSTKSWTPSTSFLQYYVLSWLLDASTYPLHPDSCDLSWGQQTPVQGLFVCQDLEEEEHSLTPNSLAWQQKWTSTMLLTIQEEATSSSATTQLGISSPNKYQMFVKTWNVNLQTIDFLNKYHTNRRQCAPWHPCLLAGIELLFRHKISQSQSLIINGKNIRESWDSEAEVI